jgi:PAS domain-containing protein
MLVIAFAPHQRSPSAPAVHSGAGRFNCSAQSSPPPAWSTPGRSSARWRAAYCESLRVRLITSLLRDEAGEPHYFIAQIEDITERKATETALADERDLLQTLMNHLPDAIYVKDNASRFLRLNPPPAPQHPPP